MPALGDTPPAVVRMQERMDAFQIAIQEHYNKDPHSVLIVEEMRASIFGWLDVVVYNAMEENAQLWFNQWMTSKATCAQTRAQKKEEEADNLKWAAEHAQAEKERIAQQKEKKEKKEKKRKAEQQAPGAVGEGQETRKKNKQEEKEAKKAAHLLAQRAQAQLMAEAGQQNDNGAGAADKQPQAQPEVAQAPAQAQLMAAVKSKAAIMKDRKQRGTLMKAKMQNAQLRGAMKVLFTKVLEAFSGENPGDALVQLTAKLESPSLDNSD